MDIAGQRRFVLKCQYVNGRGSVSANWENICADHVSELPKIRDLKPGSFNLKLVTPLSYSPPGDINYKELARRSGRQFRSGTDGGQHIAPRAKVIEIKGKAVEAWIYRGGLSDCSLELLSQPLQPLLGVAAGEIFDVVMIESEQSLLK